MSILDTLNTAQREAVEAVDGPAMIVAGAGSGKTRVLTYRAAHLLARNVRPESLLALTFTNKAAREMKGRIEALLGTDSRGLWMGTFHSVCARILRKECERLGYDRNFTIYDTDDSNALVRSIMNDLGISQQQFAPSIIRSRISTAKNAMTSPAALREGDIDIWTERTASVYEEYERRLKKSNAMDFDDLLLKPLELFTRDKAALQRYQYRFTYLLVDEYQDTNRVQYLLIKALAAAHRNICVVGDDAQSIYAFRGADIRNILDFQKDYPDCRVFRLEQNYRSTKTILDLAGSVIKHNQDQIAKTLWTDNPVGEPVELLACADDRDEAYQVVAHIEELTRRQRLALKDFAVLYRTNAQSRSMEDALRRHGIPYTLVGGVAFYQRKEVKDVLAYLRAIVNPRDDESLLRVINVPVRGIGTTSLKKIRGLAARSGTSLFDALADGTLAAELGEKTWRGVKELHALVSRYALLRKEMTVGEFTRSLIDQLGILRIYKEEGTQESLARRENVLELVAALSEFTEQRVDATLEEFLEEVALIADVDVAPTDRNTVTLMTLHAAKGLEFPVVFIAGLEEGLFPIAAASEDRKELEEERRLFYVGITRAMERLFLLSAARRYQFGVLTMSPRSRFLDELDERLIASSRSDSAPPHRERRRHIEEPRLHEARSHPLPAAQPRSKERNIDQMPDYENESQVPPDVGIGTRVEHETFGGGRVVAIDGKGDSARAVVDFDSVGRKHLMLKFANLKVR